MNLAEKHLSQYGRGGDTDIVRTSRTGPGKGDLWHVNKQEKSLIDMYGEKGERFVDKIGSGTKNPVTGLEEKSPTLLLSGAQFGLSLYQGWKQNKMEQQQARDQAKLSRNALGDLMKAEGQLHEMVTAQRDVMTQEFQTARERSGEVGAEKIEETSKQTSQLSAKTGFAGSGQVETMSQEGIEKIRTQTLQSQEGLLGEYGKAMGTIQGEYEAEKSRIKNEREKLEAEIKMYDKQSRGWAQNKVLGMLGAGG